MTLASVFPAVEQSLEQQVFGHRKPLLLCFLFITLVLAWKASGIRPDASFEKMIPLNHPYIQNYLNNQDRMQGGENQIRIAVEAKEGDIFSAAFLQTLQEINDAVFFLPGVDRSQMRSLWMPSVRWLEVTIDGFAGGPVIPKQYDGSPASLEQLRRNIMKSGEVGRLVANDFRSAVIEVPLLEVNPETGERLDYQAFSHQLESHIRQPFTSAKVDIHIVGFAKLVGDLLDGIAEIGMFALVTIAFTFLMLYGYSQCLRSALLPLVCSLVAVVWQLGLLRVLGQGLDAFSVLVPFLIFAIGVSHGVQIINGFAHEAAHGETALMSAMRTFRHLFWPGMLALTSDGIGFATLFVIDIGVIQGLAVAASIGVAVVILTNLVLLPVLLSYSGVSQRCIERAQSRKTDQSPIWRFLALPTRRGYAWLTLFNTVLLFALGAHFSQQLQVGDLDRGAPELRPDSVYNLDNQYLVDHYATSSDILVVMAKTAKDGCASYPVMKAIEDLQWELGHTSGVQSTISIVSVAKQVIVGTNEGNVRWYGIPDDQEVLNSAVARDIPATLMDADCSLVPLLVFLDDHRAETLDRAIAVVNNFSREAGAGEVVFELAAGNAGIEAATNQEIAKAQYMMLGYVYGVVILLCYVTFRSWRAVTCIIFPLILTSLLCQALMAMLGIGVKVATLPVIALGVGIGVDYGIYIYSRLASFLRLGHSLQDAYRETLATTGKAVFFTGLTLAVGVFTWVFSPIKFQADMGILLTFMFIWNMLGAIWLLPEIAYFLIREHPQISR